MVRETRHLWVGNLPDNIREDRIREHFKRYGRVQSVKLLPRVTEEKTGEITMACTVAFMDIKSASKAHNAELKIDDRTLNTEYYEPAAIPSAASPQNVSSPYSTTSPGATRFPNGHGSTDEPFPDRFYDRTPSGRVAGVTAAAAAADVEFGRRGPSAPANSYHEGTRGRPRDRSFRNGPYNSGGGLPERHNRTAAPNNTWSYENTRYNNSSTGSQSETGYSTTPSDGAERRGSDAGGVRKKTKSRSGTRSPSPGGSTSSRSPSRSRSRSSSSSSSSSTSRATSSTGSPKSRRQAAATATQTTAAEDRRPLAICVKNLPLRSSDTSLKDGLFHEYKKHGKVTWVKVVGQSTDRHAIVCFKKPEDVEKALEVSQDKLFFGCRIEVAPHTVCDVEDNDLRPYEAEIDEYHPKATRTLFIGNLEKDVTASDLRKHFDQFGEIIEIDIKKQGAVSSYAFCQYSDIVSVVKAIRKMDGEHLGNNRIKLGFGKSMPYNCVWIDGINENVNEKYLRMQFETFGVISRCIIDREKGQSLLFYEQVLHAQQAVNKMRGFVLKNTKLQVDFASRECQECFFERLEKQGTILDRTLFEDRREPATRGFESAAAARFSRYDTPTRPRTSSYSSRSSAAASQVPSAIPSPGTPGSVTPRGTSSRRIARYYDYEQADYDRHFRSYDEYSQGSAASHEDAYEHDYIYSHDSPSHLDSLEVRVMQNVVDAVPFAPPDIRNLQKERLEECASSGDELISPKKRLKLDMLDPVADVIIEANRDHRKVMEVRRLSDANLRHHRRPSMDSGKYKEAGVHDRGYMPHTVGCKRRKTNSSDGGTRVHHYDHSGSESVGGSRPGTPLCDEKPEFPSEPRRVPREREGPLTLPLPRFAAQIMNRGSVSVAGIKGQKDAVNILSSPPPATTSPRIANPRPPSPVHVPPPASPPPRPPSLSSNSSDSDGTPPSPSLEERIRSLDEKYEKWSGSRALSAAGGDALALLDANLEKFRQRHKLLDLDLKEVQPSEIVKSVMAKRSVFDEDLKRLENVGEKYEPKEFGLFPRANVLTPPLPSTPVTAPLPLKLPPVTQLGGGGGSMPSPRSSGGTPSTLPAAKGLQYPFPSHPPVQLSTQQATPTTSPVTTTAPSSTPLPAPTSTTTTTPICRGNSHGENRLKLCASASSDTRTFSKINANRNTVPIALSSVKDKSETADAPIAPTKVKSSDKTSEKVSCRRDSNSNSPRADVKTRRNSDTSARRIEENSKFGDMSESSSKNQERAKSEERKKEQRLEKVRLENERSEKERLERERIEKERIEKEKQERERLERERLEKERLERESELEKQRLEKERLEKERQELEKTKQEKERAEKEKARLEKERERAEKARQEKERAERERLESERLEKERQEEQRRKDKEEREQKEREVKEKERAERERKERERVALQEKELLEKQEKERKECERKEREDRERKEREEKSRQEEEERIRKERSEKEKQEKERSRHKEDNHHHEKKEHSSRHRENHSETKYRENNIDKHLHDGKSTKESSREEKSNKEVVHDQVHRRDLHESRSTHENSRSGHEKSRHHSDRDAERRKESIKENRDNNIHDRHKNIIETKDHRDRAAVETRHLSIDMDKSRSSDSHSKQDPNRRKERNNSLPANVGVKRRISSQDILENSEECKKIKLDKKLSERRDSKDSSRSEEKSRSSKHKNNSMRSHDKHGTGDEKRKDKDDRHKKHKLEKKSKSKSREKESRELGVVSNTISDKDFMARLNLKSVEEVEKQRKEFREGKEKRKESIPDVEKREEKKVPEERPKKDRTSSVDSKESNKPRDENSLKMSEERKSQKRERIRKMNSSDSDSDEPKKHSIFDIVDDEPAYISMYDKVKARSCKNMQKQEEEKRQEKIKAKFSQLKQSRARREEKKRSTSWDEDSDSDKETTEVKFRRHPKMLIDSSDESQDRKVIKKEGNYSDSDSFVMHQVKSEPLDTTDDEVKNKHVIYKSLKSRITSDTSDDDYQKSKLSRLFSESEPTFAEVEEKLQKTTSVKTEIERLIKKERRNSKYQESDHASQIFNDVSEPKPEKYNTIYTTDDDTVDVKKEKLERKEKKHKKKQKKQKHSHSSEESVKMDTDYVQSEDPEKSKHHEKRKEHCKKEKKRDKTRDGKDRSRKSKKNKSDTKMDVKCEGKMENIFGSLSEDSDNGVKDVAEKIQTSASFLTDENAQQPPFNSDSDREAESKPREEKSKERERDREEHKRRKEKKRRDKERRLQEAAAVTTAAVVQHNSNENSMDYVDMGKQLEANIKDDVSEETEIKTEIDSSNHDTTEDTFTFNEHTEDTRKDKDEKKEVKEVKEKKKKRKKSKDEKTKHHHHHHHDKPKVRSPEIKKDVPTDKIKTEPEEQKDAQNVSSQSLPSILESSPEHIKPSPDFTVSPSTREMLPLISPIPKTPTSSKDKKREKLIPCFGVEIDEKIHESAIKSISEFEPTAKTEEVTTEAKEEPPTESTEDKPRVIISQEETEDAVAALLGESFGREEFEECYPEDIVTVTESVPIIAEENNAEDDEEMRQAVQSLSAADLDVKPETPQSEHELQIDTDTEDQDDNNSSFEPATKTPASETPDFTKPPKTPDIQCLRPEDKTKTLQPVIYKATSIGSPPSLTPIKPVTTAGETKKTLEEPKSLPLLPEQQQRSVITQSWTKENTREVIVSKPDSVTVPEEAAPQSVISQVSSTRASSPVRTFRATPVITVKENNYPPLATLSKDSIKLSPVAEQKIQPSPVIHAAVKSPTVSQLHNLPARPPVQISKPAGAAQEPSLLSPKSSAGLTLNRLPITPVMASKPIQPTTVFLPQSKIAHSLEPPKLVSTSDPRSPERPRMVFQTASMQQPYSNFGQNQPRVLMQGNIRHLPPPGLLMPTRHLPPTTYGYMPPHSSCEPMPDVKRTEPSPVKLSTSVTATNSQLRPTLAMSSANVLPQVSSSLLSLPSYSPNSMQQPSLKLPVSVTCSSPKPFIQTKSPNLVTTHPIIQTNSPVIQEPPKLIGIPLASEVQYKPVELIATESKVNDTSVLLSPKNLEGKVISAPSPVIVPNPLPEAHKVDDSKLLSPVKLAIEKVTEELNMSLTKEVEDKECDEQSEEEPELKTKVEEHQEHTKEKPEDAEKTETKDVSVSNEPEKLEEEKMVNTEIKIKDDTTEGSDSTYTLAKDDPLDTKEDSDYWSAKEVNIDSVIKTLASADELSEHGSEDNVKDEWLNEQKEQTADTHKQSDQSSLDPSDLKHEDPLDGNQDENDVDIQKNEENVSTRGGRNRGRGGRGRKVRGAVERGGITTRRGKLAKEVPTTTSTPAKRGRGGRPRHERKSSRSESDSAPSDVYEFRDDSDDNNKEQRPRLVLTIKSSSTSSTSNSHTTAIVKEITKDGAKEIGKESVKETVPTPATHKQSENKDEFVSPQTNTRKSRRLQEKDIKNTVDDTIEDVVKNTIQTRSSSNQRKSSRLPIAKQIISAIQLDTPRKSPRGRKPRRGSEAAENSSSEETSKEEVNKPVETPIPPQPPMKEPEKEHKPVETPREKVFGGVKAAMLRRLKGEMAANAAASHEPTNLIDPVTGLLIPMRECEEGRYIPLPDQKSSMAKQTSAIASVEPTTVESKPLKEPAKSQPSTVPPPSQQVTVVQQQSPKLQSLKAHVLNSQAAKAVVTQQPQVIQAKPVAPVMQVQQSMPPQHSVVVTKTVTPVAVSKPVTPLNQTLNINTSVAMGSPSVAHLSPRPNIPNSVTAKPQANQQQQQMILSAQQKQFIQTSKPLQHIPKAHIHVAPAQVVNTQMAHMKQNVLKQPQVIMGKGPLPKTPHSLHQQQILTGQVASPPLTKTQAPSGRIIQGPPPGQTKGVMEPPKVDVSMSNIMLGRPNLSPGGHQSRITGLPVSGFEASLGEAITHFPPGALRPPPELNPAHYMHTTHVLQYQQFLRQQQLQHLQRSAGLEKSGEEGEEAPVTSPPLELRRPGSVGLALSGRGAAVPHSLHSPHDRATESPQMGQVYSNMPHSSRIPPYHPNRYYDQAEPPPAHRPLTSHGSLAALGSDRGLAAHLQPDRPLSGSHLPPDRPLSSHTVSAHMGGMPSDRMSSHIERPLSSHGIMGAGLGAAGNLMGAVAKHIGVEAPTSQRGLQAATPPHASQVPPQAESLLMLLKQYPLMWQGLLALKNDQAAVQMYFVSGNDNVAKCSLPKNTDGTTPPLRIFQRMRLEPPQVEGVARKMQTENEHCMLLALPCGHDHMDVLKQSTNLTNGFITYLQQKQAAGIVNVAAPGTTQPPAYVVHIFPSCDFVNENLRRIAPSLLERVADIAHLLIVITTV